MRVTVGWLREFVDFDLSVEELCRGLTFLGVEVSSFYSERQCEAAGELLRLSQEEGFELDDTVIDLEITPNRPDCLGVIGVAREVSVLADVPVRQRRVRLSESGREAASAASLEVVAQDACPRYIGRVVAGIKVGESPGWLKRRLLAVGLRPVNNVVDIANYLMIETGQPMHCFDLDKLAGGQVVVRFAKAGEHLLMLDGQDRALFPEALVIADAVGPVALAGVMGGADSAVVDTTRNVFVECAVFDRRLIRRTSRRLGLQTESSYRFERGVDIGATDDVSKRAAQLISELCGGSILAGSLEAYPRPYQPRSVRFRPERVCRILGTRIDAHLMEKMLLSLGFAVCREVDDQDGTILVEPPSFRVDVSCEEDLVEEVARVYGYDRIAPQLPRPRLSTDRLTTELRLHRRVRQTLKSFGMCEVWTLGLIGDSLLERCLVGQEHPLRRCVVLRNPLSSDEDRLRSFLLPSLLLAASHNARHKVLDRWLFGLGNVFVHVGEKAPRERMHIAILGSCDIWPENWARRGTKASFFHVKGVVARLMEELALPEPELSPAFLPFAEASECCEVSVSGEPVGFLGRVHPEVAAAFALSGPVYFAELNLQTIGKLRPHQRKFRPFSLFPAVVLDLSVTVSKDTHHSQVEAIIREVGAELVEDVKLFDRYEGEQVPPDRVSLAYSITYRAKDRTLTVEEAFGRQQKVVEALSERIGARLRE